MLRCEDFIGWLSALGVDFYAGVPDSLLGPVCAYLEDHAGGNHIVAANEGGAVALACGYHLATRKIPLVYLQNSGQGNAVNPLTSLAHTFRIPMLLIATLRGEPGGAPDEPQHELMGSITTRIST